MTKVLQILYIALALFLIESKVFASSDSVIHEQEDAFGNEKIVSKIELAFQLVTDYPDSSIHLAQYVLNYTSQNQTSLRAKSYFVIGEGYFYKNDNSTALSNYYQAKSLFEEIKDTFNLAQLTNSLGLIYYYESHYDSAMICFQAGLKYEISLDNTLGVAKSHQNIGLIHYQMDDLDRFFKHCNIALDLYEKIDDNKHIADISNNMAVAYSSMDDYKQSGKYYNIALKGYESIGDSVGVANVLTNIGNLLFYQDQYLKAIKYLKEAIERFKSIEHDEGLIHAHSRLGDVYFEMGQSEKAIQQFLLCEELNKNINNNDLKLKNLKSLSEAYRYMKDFERALRLNEEYIVLKDSVYNEEKFNVIYKLEKEYEEHKAHQDIKVLRAERKWHNILLIAGIAFSVLLFLFSFLWYRQKQIKETQRRIRLEQRILRTQMSPHFLFNTLSMIQYYVLENRTIEAIDYIGDFSKLVRMVMQTSQEEFITLETEKSLLDGYLSLASKRFGNKINYLIHIDDNIDLKHTLIPPMLSQPFIENAIEHGELGRKSVGNIWVSFTLEHDRIKFRIQDDGIGIEKSLEKKQEHAKKSMAIKNTKERLRLMNTVSTITPVELIIEDLSKYGKNGTLIEFSIPFKIIK